MSNSNAAPVLADFNTALETASGNIGEVQAAVTSAREGAEDIRWAVGTFGRIEDKADDVAKIIGGLADILNLLGKVGPIGRAFKPLERVLKQIEDAVESVEAKAKQIDESRIVTDLKGGVEDAITRISELEGDVAEKRAQFDERVEPISETNEAINTAAEFIDVSSVASALDAISGPPLTAANALNNLFGVETDPDSVAGKLAAFNDAVAGNPLREAQQMEADICAVIDQLGVLSKPFDILDSALSPIRWALDASDFVFDTVVSPVLDPILDAIGVTKIFDGVRKKLEDALLPGIDIDILDGFDTNGILPDLDVQLLPGIDLGDFLGLNDLLDQANIAIDPANFTGAQLETGTDGNDILGAFTSAVKQVLSGGAGIDLLRGGLDIDIFKGGAGDDVIDGGIDETSGDMVLFSGGIAEYLIEFADDTVEVLDEFGNVIRVVGDIIVSHVDPATGLVGDGIDVIRNVEKFVFEGLEITAADLRNGLDVMESGATGSFDGRLGDQRDYLVATAAGSTGTGVTLNGKGGNDHLIGTAFSDNLFGGAGDDVLDGGPNQPGALDILNGGIGIDEVTFASSARDTGEQLDLGAVDRGSSILLSSVSAIDIERIEGSDYEDVLFGREVQNIDGDPANDTYIERLAGGDGSDLLRGFGGDDRLEGNEGADILIGDGGANQYLGGIGDDLMILDATTVGQQIDGGDGFDTLVYGGLPTIVSTFNDSDDGWTAPTGTLTRETANGQPGEGGYLQHIDSAPSVTDYFIAPAKFLGDQSQMFGGRISFDLESPVVSNYSVGVALTGGANGTTRLEADIDIFRDLGWQSFDIQLSAQGSWRVHSGTNGEGAKASDALIQEVLSNLSSIELLTDRVNGVETTRLDNFVLSALPVQDAILSDFSTGLEGWTTVLKAGGAEFDAAFGTAVSTDWISSGGNAGAYMEVTNSNDRSWAVAPEKFLGDQSDKLYGRIEVALSNQQGGAGYFSEQDEIALVGAGMTLVADLVPPNYSGTWNRNGVSLDPSLWFTIGQRTTPVTQSELMAVLSDLEGLYIRTGYRAGTERFGIDEVRLAPPSDDLSAKALDFMSQTLDEYPVAELTGRVDVDVAAGTVTRYDASDTQIAQDSFSGVEQIIGGEQSDNFIADLATPDAEITLRGQGGNDSFTIAAGKQVVDGGTGDDAVTLTARGFEQGERYDGGDGIDTLDLSGVDSTKWRLDFNGELRGVDWTLSEADLLASQAASVANFERILTGEHDDVIRGEFSFIDSGAGNDDIFHGQSVTHDANLGEGDDYIISYATLGGTIDLGLGNDISATFGGTDGNVLTIIGGPATAIDADGEPLPEDDVFLLGSGRNHVIGGDGQDIVSFGSNLVFSGVDVTLDLSDGSVNAGGASGLTFTGVENASGGTGDDIILGEAGANLLIGGAGDDLILGEGVGVDVPGGEGAGDVLYGNDGNDRLRGLTGDDLLHGGTGDNILEGGDGIDTASYSFEEIGAVGTDGVVQSINRGLLAEVTADLGLFGSGSATRTIVLHQDDFEGGVAGYEEYGHYTNRSDTLPGFGKLAGPFSVASAPEMTKTFDLGEDVDLTQPITVSFDFIEIDGFNGESITVVMPGGSVAIAFTDGVPQATSGTGSTNGTIPAPIWTVQTDASQTGDIGGGADTDYVHRISVTFQPQGQFVPIGFGKVGFGSDKLRFDNLKITGATSTDTLSDIENLIGGALNDELTGNSQDNALNGGAGDDILRGLGGDDVLLDGAGADVVEAGDGDDTVVAGRGSDDGRGDSYDGGAGIDTLDYSGLQTGVSLNAAGQISMTYDVDAPVWADTQTMEARSFGSANYTPRDIAQALDPDMADGTDDLLRDLSDIPDPASLIDTPTQSVSSTGSYTGFEVAIGSDFDDGFQFGNGLIRAEGGLGDDFYNLESESAAVIVEEFDGGYDIALVAFSYVLADHLEQVEMFDGDAWDLTGNSRDNFLAANNSDNRIEGAFGQDTLLGFGGDDILIGGLGDDLLDGGSGVDTASYEGAGGRVAVFLNKAPADVGSGQGVDTFVSIENIIGSDFDDRIVGDGADNTLWGGIGDDVIIGNAGDDTIHGERGDDQLIGSGGNDMIFGGAGADVIDGLGGADVLNGEGGDDTINGGTGVDNIIGGGGKDDIFGLFGADFLFGGTNDDNIRAGGSGDTVHGGNGNDRLVGGNGKDSLWGGQDNDVLFGGSGTGGGDGLRDEFVFKSAANGGGGFDIIRDFENNIDKLDLSESGYTDFADVLADASEIGADLEINFDFGGTVLIENFTLAEFNSGDLIF